jgi:chemotaxis protein histidine kinase CheA
VPGIAGATVMGDGRVALILDVDVMVNQTNSAARAMPMPEPSPVFERTLAGVN